MNILKFTILLLIILAPLFAFAAVDEPGVISLPNPLSVENFEELINVVINWLLVITLPIIVLLIVYAGFQYMFGGVNPELQRTSGKIVLYAVIGYAIILLSKVLLGVITGLFG